MSLQVLWFDKSSAGAGDATSWENRAALFDGSGNWSSILTGIDFTSVSFAEARIAASTPHDCTQTLASSLFANPPAAGRLRFQGLNDDGSLWEPPFWTADMPHGWVDTLPRINHDATTACIFLAIECVGLSIVNTSGGGSNTAAFRGVPSPVWCHARREAGAGRDCFNGAILAQNCVGELTGTNAGDVFNTVGAPYWYNCRAVGGNNGFTTNTGVAKSCASVGSNYGFFAADGPQQRFFNLLNCTISANTAGVRSNSTTAANATPSSFVNNFIVAPIGIEHVDRVITKPATYNRIRATTPISSDSMSFIGENYTASGNDADEFVDATSGDYRIKSSSIYWPLGVGVSRESSAGGASRPINPFIQQVIG